MKKHTTFEETRTALQQGNTTCAAVTEHYLETIAKEQQINAFLDVFREDARAQARVVDRKIEEGTAGVLAGMVMAVKDVLCMKNRRVTCGSKILESFVALYDATVVEALRREDAVLIGKTNMDEFAMGSSTENSAFGPVLNPVDQSRVPGGSSGGSGAAVAAGMSHAALGTDTGGSIRQPASFCGIVGLKPTYGRVSRYGLVALSSSFDQIGPFANCVRDAARVLGVIAGHDPLDSTSADLPVPDYLAALTGDIRGMRIGVPSEAFGEGLQQEVRESLERAMEILRTAGAEIRTITLPHSRYNISTYYILMTAEASSNLARYDGARYGYRAPDITDLTSMYVESRSRGFGAEAKRRIMLGTYVLSAGYYDAYYRKAQKVRRLIQKDFLNAFTQVECILTPTSPTTAFTFGEKADDPLQMYLSDIYTVSANLAGVPAISVPFGSDNRGLPIGIQLIGKQFDEDALLRAAEVLEKAENPIHSH
ncbi:MAG: Asp-tRNA(Asn)/Glu-tRNA(Gln) amidotransferase subunit GatA [Ignavibacteria bacterium]|nr:Asp-tRNA(Asn)/Glu-tRNA(Gln) amidotransferase subunit GatA [Ignavibacteria bacterium]